MTLELTATPNNKGVDAAVAAARRVSETLVHARDIDTYEAKIPQRQPWAAA